MATDSEDLEEEVTRNPTAEVEAASEEEAAAAVAGSRAHRKVMAAAAAAVVQLNRARYEPLEHQNDLL